MVSRVAEVLPLIFSATKLHTTHRQEGVRHVGPCKKMYSLMRTRLRLHSIPFPISFQALFLHQEMNGSTIPFRGLTSYSLCKAISTRADSDFKSGQHHTLSYDDIVIQNAKVTGGRNEVAFKMIFISRSRHQEVLGSETDSSLTLQIY
jgi:hypothetical protein